MPNTPVENPERRVYPTNASDYVLKEEIGQGTSAKVYMAHCVPLNEMVAIKCLDLEKNNIDMDDIRKEIHLITTIVHPNVVRAHCSFVKDSFLWVVMPFMSGGSCYHIMKFMYPDGLEEIVIATILKETLKALEFIHRQGHIHRDVKAGNILIDSAGHVKVADFGVAACMFDTGDRQRSRNTFVGTPCWMAPEVMEQLHGYDFKADIWSFGITALELAHGHAPFSKYPPMKVLLMTLQNAPPTLSSEREKKFSKSFKEMVAMCLVKDPQKRPSAEKLLKHTFFKQAKSNEYLAKHLLDGLPPLSEREKVLKSKDEVRLAAKKIPSDVQEEMSQNEYKRGVSSWNFNVEDLKKQAALMKDDEDYAENSIKEEDESLVSPGIPRVKSKRDNLEESLSGPLSSPLNTKPENLQSFPSNQSLPSQSSSQNLASKALELPPLDPRVPRPSATSTSTKSLSKSQGASSKKERQQIGRFEIIDDDDDDDDDESWHEEQYKAKFPSSLSLPTINSSAPTNSLPISKAESFKEPTSKTEEKKDREKEKENERDKEKEREGNHSSDSEHGGSQELKPRVPAPQDAANLGKLPHNKSSSRLNEDDRAVEKTSDESSRDRRLPIITSQSVKDLTSEEKIKTLNSEKVQRKGRFSVTTDTDLVEDIPSSVRKNSVHISTNAQSIKSHLSDHSTAGSFSNSQPVTPVSSTNNESVVSLSIVIPHLQNLLKHITEQQDVVFNLLCSLSSSEQGLKSTRPSNAFISEFGLEMPSEKERELMQQVVDLQARVASLEGEQATLKSKNAQLERQLNVFYNKEQEEKIRKEEAAREES